MLKEIVAATSIFLTANTAEAISKDIALEVTSYHWPAVKDTFKALKYPFPQLNIIFGTQKDKHNKHIRHYVQCDWTEKQGKRNYNKRLSFSDSLCDGTINGPVKYTYGNGLMDIEVDEETWPILDDIYFYVANIISKYYKGEDYNEMLDNLLDYLKQNANTSKLINKK